MPKYLGEIVLRNIKSGGGLRWRLMCCCCWCSLLLFEAGQRAVACICARNELLANLVSYWGKKISDPCCACCGSDGIRPCMVLSKMHIVDVEVL